jgi:hypothetical protein
MLLVAGCSGSVAVAPPQPAPNAECAATVSALPSELDGLDRRTVEPESEYTAAFGRPAVTMVCGVPRPEALRDSSPLIVIDGVDWFAEELTAGTRFTTVGRVASLQVDVPDEYEPAADLLVPLAPVILAGLPISATASPAG